MKEKKQLSGEEILEKIRHYCAYQERSRLQVLRKLRQLGCSELEEDNMLKMLAEGNYLNERRFVEQYIRSRSAAKGWGPARLSQALLRETGATHREEISGNSESLKKALQKLEKDLLKKKQELLRRQDPMLREKLLRFCLSRGFDFETALKVVSGVGVSEG